MFYRQTQILGVQKIAKNSAILFQIWRMGCNRQALLNEAFTWYLSGPENTRVGRSLFDEHRTFALCADTDIQCSLNSEQRIHISRALENICGIPNFLAAP